MCMKRDVMGQTAIDGVEGLNRAGELDELGRFSRSRQLMWGHALYLMVVPEFLRTLVFARPRGDDQFADCTFSPSLDMSR